jgi:hypothetical protein
MLGNHLRGVLVRTLFPLMLPLVLAGCNPARQDRSITFSKDGDAVGFQHDAEDIFVAGKDGGPPIKVFEPGPDVAAVSTPLWNPKDQRLIFTTATPLDGGKVSARTPRLFGGGEDPAGALFDQRAVTYTCWLRGEPVARIEIRISKSETHPNTKLDTRASSAIRLSDFVFVSDFGIRILALGLVVFVTRLIIRKYCC